MSAKRVITVDPAKVRAWIEKNHLSMADVSDKIGYASNYISGVICTGKISKPAIEMLKLKYGIKDGAFDPDPEPVNPPAVPAPLDYSTRIHVMPDKVRFEIFFGNEEIYHAYSRIKANAELDLIQAISYAAHICYKMAEQKELGGKRNASKTK